MGQISVRHRIHQPRFWLEAVLDLLFPPQCAGCSSPGSVWCSSCAADLETLTRPDVRAVRSTDGEKWGRVPSLPPGPTQVALPVLRLVPPAPGRCHSPSQIPSRPPVGRSDGWLARRCLSDGRMASGHHHGRPSKPKPTQCSAATTRPTCWARHWVAISACRCAPTCWPGVERPERKSGLARRRGEKTSPELSWRHLRR